MLDSVKSVQSRLLGAVLAFELSKNMVSSGLLMLQPSSMIGKAGRLSSSPEVFSYIWIFLALLVVPYMLVNFCGKWNSRQKVTTRLACWSILASGVLWVYLASLSKGLDYGNLTEVFLLHGLSCIASSTLMAYSLRGINYQKSIYYEP